MPQTSWSAQTEVESRTVDCVVRQRTQPSGHTVLAAVPPESGTGRHLRNKTAKNYGKSPDGRVRPEARGLIHLNRISKRLWKSSSYAAARYLGTEIALDDEHRLAVS